MKSLLLAGLGFVFFTGTYASAMGPKRPAPPPDRLVTKDDRTLLVTTNFVTYGDPKYTWLYKFLESSSVLLARAMLKSDYRNIYLLPGKNATGTNFSKDVELLATDPSIKALDVFVHLHGSPNTLWFQDGAYSSSDLKSSWEDSRLKGRARLFYSTACYGQSQAQDFVDAGFQVASGSIAVNADSAWSYPETMGKWRSKTPYNDVVKAANLGASIWISDHIARLMGFTDVNSRKELKGDPATRIDISPL